MDGSQVMRRKGMQRGEGQLGCIVGLIILLVASYVAYKMIPVKVRSAEVRGVVVDAARSAGRFNDKQIHRLISDKARDNRLPIGEKDIKIRRTGGSIRIEVEFVVPVEFPGYTYQWRFKHVAENPIF